MYYKFFLNDNVISVPLNEKISFSFTELENEPSLVHSHPHTEIIVPQNEFGQIVCGSEIHTPKPQQIFIIPPYFTHTEINISPKENFKYFIVTLQSTVINPQPSNANENIIIVSPPRDTVFNELINYLKVAKKHCESDSPDNEAVTLNVFSFYHVFMNYLRNSGYFTASKNAMSYSSIIRETMHYISQNYGSDINIETLAHQYGISRSFLDKKFKGEVGISPKEYLLNKRIDTARRLLNMTDYTVSQISSLCGFNSPAYFTFIFKKETSLTPKEFRKQNKKPKTQ